MEKEFTKLEDKEHILRNPDMYVGSMDATESNELLMVNNLFTEKKIWISDALKRIFLEVLSNAGDNVIYSRQHNVSPGTIEVRVDEKSFMVINEGKEFPVEVFDKETGELNPKFVFGVFRVSSNYSGDRAGAGKNGYGAKLANLLSKTFVVDIKDSKNSQDYQGIWRNNMSEFSDRSIPGYSQKAGKWVPNKGPKVKNNRVKIYSEVDFSKFTVKGKPMTEFSEDIVNLFKRYTVEYSITCRVPVVFNNVKYDFVSLKKFSSLIFPEKTKTAYYIGGNKIPDEPLKELESKAEKKEFMTDSSHIEVLVLDTPKQGKTISYVNGLMTTNNGIHVNKFLTKFKSEVFDSSKVAIRMDDIQHNFSFIVVARVLNPLYDSQTKTELKKADTIRLKFDDKFFKQFTTWSAYSAITEVTKKKVSKTDGTNQKHVNVTKLEDAIRAGDKDYEQRSKCTFYLVEGESAAAYPKKRIAMMGGKEYNGYYPIQGKFINVTNTKEDLDTKVEFTNIKKALGLKENVDYSIEANFKQLRYGKIIITTDADVDGKHILSLILNMFSEKWPGLLQQNFVHYLMTPVIRVYKNEKADEVIQKFYIEEEFEEWIKTNKQKVFIKYFKGLGSSTDKDIIDDVSDAPIVKCVPGDTTAEVLKRAFDAKNSDVRKKWIEESRSGNQVDTLVEIKKPLYSREINSIINIDLAEFSVSNLFRAIPSQKDFLKKSQRQVIYAMLEEFKYGDVKITKKVANTASIVSQRVNYHHGETSLYDTIIGMAQTFVGSNNLAFCYQDGQFGTRDKGGDDAAAPRYISTRPEAWVKLAYNKEMIDIIEKRKVEGENAEPVWLPCDIPIGLINGCEGIGTGWSTKIPSINPLVCIDYLIAKCERKSELFSQEFEPWYNLFKGDIIFNKTAFISEGKFEILKENADSTYDVRITELPVGVWFNKYTTDFIKVMFNQTTNPPTGSSSGGASAGKKYTGPTIKDYEDYGTAEEYNMVITGFSEKPTLKSLNLISKKFNLTNMNLIDDNGYVTNFKTIEDLIDNYFVSMKNVYSKYWQIKRDTLADKVKFEETISRFIQLVVDKKIVFVNTPLKEVEKAMTKYNIPLDYIDKIKVSAFTEENVKKHMKLLHDLIDELQEFDKTNPLDLWRSRLIKLKAFVENFYNEQQKQIESQIKKQMSGKLLFKKKPSGKR